MLQAGSPAGYLAACRNGSFKELAPDFLAPTRKGELESRAKEFADIIKIGRTHTQVCGHMPVVARRPGTCRLAE